MKKLLYVLLVTLLLLSGCTKKEDLNKMFVDAINKTNEMNDINMDFSIAARAMGADGKIDLSKGTVQMKNITNYKDLKSLEGMFNLSFNLTGKDTNMSSYLKEGVLYTNLEEMIKIKDKIDDNETLNSLLVENNETQSLVSDEFVSSLTTSKVDGEYYFTHQFDKNILKEFFEKAGPFVDEIIPINNNPEEVFAKFVLGKDKELSRIELGLTAPGKKDLDGLSIRISITMTLVKGDLNIEYPDFSDYIDSNNLGLTNGLDF